MHEGTEEVTLTYDAMIQDIPGATCFVSKSERIVYWMLAKAKGKMVRETAIWDALYSTRPDCDHPDMSIIKVWISHLRKKIPGVVIQNHRHLGYSMEPRNDA